MAGKVIVSLCTGAAGLLFLICLSPAWPQATANAPAGAPNAPNSAPHAETPDHPLSSPGAVYKEAMHPLDVVRSSMDNWSDAELGAFAVGLQKAQVACAQAEVKNYSGEDLFDLARLCSFAQNWNQANSAALAYVAGNGEVHRTQAYVLSMNALARQNRMDEAFETAREILRKLPYDAESAYAMRYLIEDLGTAGDVRSMLLAGFEEPHLLAALRQRKPLQTLHGDAAIGVGALYQAAMRYPQLLYYFDQSADAAKAAAEVERALQNEAGLSVEDRQRIEAAHIQFQLLGHQIPEIAILRSMQGAGTTPKLGPDYGVVSVFVVFPDWCAQCRRMMKPLTEFAAINRDVPVYAYGLMFFEARKEAASDKTPAKLDDLESTATLIVPPEAAQSLGAIDYPLGILVNRQGVVHFVGSLPGDAFNGHGFVNRAITQLTMNGQVGGDVPSNPPAR